MNKHTPGPWHVAASAGVYDRHNRLIAAIYSPMPQPCEANARLIAAAPDLLEALKMGYADTMDYIQLNRLGAENNHWLVLARAAIAKATGEKQ